mgnify:CR=1 FL=1
MNHLMPSEIWQKQVLTFAPGDVLDMEAMKAHWYSLAMNGRHGPRPGQFAIRGGILDVYPLTEENPVRIELWGDEVDSIRTFDPESQRSIEQVDEAVIYPATEMALTPEQIQDGTEAIEKDRRKYVKKLRDAMKTEEAYRMDSAVSEVLDGLREGFRVHGLGSYIRYFCKETVSFFKLFSSR